MAFGGWGFKDKEIAERLKRLAERNASGISSNGRRNRRDGEVLETGGMIFKMTETITARSGTTPGVGTCNPYYLNNAHVLTEAKDNAGSSISVEVYNMSETAISYTAGKYILAKYVIGVPIIDVEFCE